VEKNASLSLPTSVIEFRGSYTLSFYRFCLCDICSSGLAVEVSALHLLLKPLGPDG